MMSKELEALERIKKCLFWSDEGLNDIATIEQALKEHQEINTKYKLAIEFIDNVADVFDEHDLEELADKIVKVKKALEVIRNIEPLFLSVTLDKLLCCDYINKEQYNSLKEVLL